MRRPSFLDLSPQQQELLLGLPFEGRHLVSGPPGSGKTLLAVYRAVMLDIADRDVVVLTHSNALRQYTRDLVRDLGFRGTVTTCHSWFQEFWDRRFSERPPTTENGVGLDWLEIASKLGRLPARLTGEIDCLVVDEGQDLHNLFYALCQDLATTTTVFADDNQRIGDDQSTLREIQALLGSDTKHHRIDWNHRNTRQIWELAMTFYCGDDGSVPPPPVREGPLPSLQRHRTENEFVDRVAAYALKHRKSEIGVVLPHQRQLVPMMDGLHRRGVRNVQAYVGGNLHFRDLDYSRPGVKIFSPVSVKGQEFDTLFAHNLELYTGDFSAPTLRMQLHVITTRARTALHLSYQSENEPEVVRNIPGSVLLRSGTSSVQRRTSEDGPLPSS